MATNIPPHNLNEVVDACIAVLGNPDIDIEELIAIVPAPDFPTAGIIYGTADVKEGYRTGRGRVVMRARAHVEDMERAGKQAIVVDELPYQVGGDQLLKRISELVHEKKIEGIADLRNESDKSGMRLVIELKRGEVAEIVLNNLYKLTQMQETFGMNMVALLDGQPKLLNLKQFLDAFLRHRREVVTRRTVFDLRKARERGHVLEGLAVALSNVDEVIAIIKAAATPAVAKTELMARTWRSPLVEEMLARASAGAVPPREPAQGFRARGERLPALRRAGAAHPRDAAAAPHRARAGQDPLRVPRGDRGHRGPARHPRAGPSGSRASSPTSCRRSSASSATRAAARSW